MLVKRPVIVTAIVTDGLKTEFQREIEEQMRRLNESQQELESQSRRYMLQLPSAEMANAFRRQVEEETRKHDAARKELKDRQEAVSQLVLGERVTYMQLEGYIDLQTGDNLLDKLGRAEITIRDGIVQEVNDGTGGASASAPASAPGRVLIQRG